MMNFFENAVLGFCWWDIPGLLFLVAITGWFLAKRHKLKREKEDLQK